MPIDMGRAFSGWWPIAGQASRFTAADPPQLHRPLAYRHDAPAVDIVFGTSRQLG